MLTWFQEWGDDDTEFEITYRKISKSGGFLWWVTHRLGLRCSKVGLLTVRANHEINRYRTDEYYQDWVFLRMVRATTIWTTWASSPWWCLIQFLSFSNFDSNSLRGSILCSLVFVPDQVDREFFFILCVLLCLYSGLSFRGGERERFDFSRVRGHERFSPEKVALKLSSSLYLLYYRSVDLNTTVLERNTPNAKLMRGRARCRMICLFVCLFVLVGEGTVFVLKSVL